MTGVKDLQKLRGGYYTPSEITSFITRWAINSPEDKVLEPSCGDGNFIEAAIKRFQDLGLSNENLHENITGIELIEKEAKKAAKRSRGLGMTSDAVINSDFFQYISEHQDEQFDVVIGNPPFIRYQNFPEKHRSLAMEMMQHMGMHPNRLTNIWLPFLVICCHKLKVDGRLGMVIPAELFSVKYAAETRIFLSNFFQRITIATFRKLVFDGIQQEVILLLCEKRVDDNEGIRVIEFDHLQDMVEFDFTQINNIEVKTIDHNSEKWTKYFLEENEINLLRTIKARNDIPLCNDIMDVDVGIVTGRNEFFMLSKSEVEKWGLEEHTKKVTSRSNQLKGIVFNPEDFQTNSSIDLKIYLFLPPNVDFNELPQECKRYIKYGEKNGFNKGYKCRIRKRWYITPSLWNCDAFALRQVNDYPKLVLNDVECSSTDTIHRVRFLSNHHPRNIILSFFNSLTFAFSEITGRSYGGGVMTFEPTEVELLPIPIYEIENINFDHIDNLIREKRIEEVLDIIDQIILIDHYGFTLEQTLQLRGIWRKLSSRRINRKKK